MYMQSARVNSIICIDMQQEVHANGVSCREALYFRAWAILTSRFRLCCSRHACEASLHRRLMVMERHHWCIACWHMRACMLNISQLKLVMLLLLSCI